MYHMYMVSCLIQLVVLMIMWKKFAKILTANNYQLHSIGKIRKYLDKPRTEKNDKFGSDIPFGLLQQPSVWYQWITLPE